MFHIDRHCDAALIQLDNALSSFAKATGREYTLILVPESSGEKIHISLSGRPLPGSSYLVPEEILAMAMKKREKA